MNVSKQGDEEGEQQKAKEMEVELDYEVTFIVTGHANGVIRFWTENVFFLYIL